MHVKPVTSLHWGFYMPDFNSQAFLWHKEWLGWGVDW